jgi:hypothetical protein
MREMNLEIHSAEKGDSQGFIVSAQADGTKIKTPLKGSGHQVTLAKIRVGFFGDEEVPRTVDRYIRAELKKDNPELR